MKQEIVASVGDPSRAELFERISGKALAVIEEILDLPNKASDFADDEEGRHKRLRMQLDAAQGIVANQVKIDEASLRHVERTDLLEILRQDLKNIKLPEKGS